MSVPTDEKPEGGASTTPSSDPEMVKVKDRLGRVKVIPRAEFEARKRRRKRHEANKSFPFKEVFSVIIILAIICLASYIALNLVK